MEKVILTVEGMSCAHCVRAVNQAVGGLDGVSKVDVDLAKKTVTIEHDPSVAPLARIKAEIEDQGYEVVS